MGRIGHASGSDNHANRGHGLGCFTILYQYTVVKIFQPLLGGKSHRRGQSGFAERRDVAAGNTAINLEVDTLRLPHVSNSTASQSKYSYRDVAAIVACHWVYALAKGVPGDSEVTKRTEQDGLGLFNGFSESAHWYVNQASITLLGGVEEVHQQCYPVLSGWNERTYLTLRTSFQRPSVDGTQ